MWSVHQGAGAFSPDIRLRSGSTSSQQARRIRAGSRHFAARRLESGCKLVEWCIMPMGLANQTTCGKETETFKQQLELRRLPAADGQAPPDHNCAVVRPARQTMWVMHQRTSPRTEHNLHSSSSSCIFLALACHNSQFTSPFFKT